MVFRGAWDWDESLRMVVANGILSLNMTYCWWLKHQLRLVVYPIMYRISRWCRISSINSTSGYRTWKESRSRQWGFNHLGVSHLHNNHWSPNLSTNKPPTPAASNIQTTSLSWKCWAVAWGWWDCRCPGVIQRFQISANSTHLKDVKDVIVLFSGHLRRLDNHMKMESWTQTFLEIHYESQIQTTMTTNTRSTTLTY